MKTHSEIIEKYSNWKVAPEAIINEALIFSPSMILPAMQEVENQTREEMFEFVEWITDCDNVMCTDGVYFIFELSEERGHTLKQCYTHWKQLNK